MCMYVYIYICWFSFFFLIFGCRDLWLHKKISYDCGPESHLTSESCPASRKKRPYSFPSIFHFGKAMGIISKWKNDVLSTQFNRQAASSYNGSHQDFTIVFSLIIELWIKLRRVKKWMSSLCLGTCLSCFWPHRQHKILQLPMESPSSYSIPFGWKKTSGNVRKVYHSANELLEEFHVDGTVHCTVDHFTELFNSFVLPEHFKFGLHEVGEQLSSSLKVAVRVHFWWMETDRCHWSWLESILSLSLSLQLL